MPVVELSFTPLPAHVRTARLIAAAIARRANVEPEVVDEIRLAVGEACSRAVGLHQSLLPDRPVRLTLSVERGQFEVVVIDEAPATDADLASSTDLSVSRFESDDDYAAGINLAVIAGLVDGVDVSSTPTGGTQVHMSWPCGDVARDTVLAEV